MRGDQADPEEESRRGKGGENEGDDQTELLVPEFAYVPAQLHYQVNDPGQSDLARGAGG